MAATGRINPRENVYRAVIAALAGAAGLATII